MTIYMQCQSLAVARPQDLPGPALTERAAQGRAAFCASPAAARLNA